jgi:hypothetical protein
VSLRKSSPLALGVVEEYSRTKQPGERKTYAPTASQPEPAEGTPERVGVFQQVGVAVANWQASEPSSVVCGPWLSVVDAARHAGWPCPNGRAPASFYVLAARIGVKLNGKWRVHVDDLDAELRRHAVTR